MAEGKNVANNDAMDKLRPLLVAVPAFALGALLTAMLTTRAEAQGPQTVLASVATQTPQHTYLVATSVAQMNGYGQNGWDVVGPSVYNPIKKRMEWTMRRPR